MTSYDYIIIGAGASGLQLALAFLEDDFFTSKTIALIEKDEKTTNDRTWCFWEAGKGKWDELLTQTWDYAAVSDQDTLNEFSLTPYQYKMLRSRDFYAFSKKKVGESRIITTIQDEVRGVDKLKGVVSLASGEQLKAKVVFDSRLNKRMFEGSKKYYYLKQHFLGWYIQTTTPVFEEGKIHFMDFRVPQQGNTRFMYLLPLSKDIALLEYTLFSHDLLKIEGYESAVKAYLEEFYPSVSYTLLEKEYGVIPMTNAPMEKDATKHWMPIGTAGGWTKASTGFTFKMIERNVKLLVAQLKQGTPKPKVLINKKFRFYDSILLNILHHHNEKGGWLFEELFRRVAPAHILKFLNEETSFKEDVQLFYKSPKMIFLEGFFRNLWR